MSKVTLITMEYPPFHGGVGNYYYNLVKSINDQITVFAEKRNLNVENLIPGVNYVNLLNKKGPLKWLKIFFLVKNLLNQERQQVIWVGNILPIGSACWLASKVFKIKYFVSLHGLDWQTACLSSRKKWLASKVLDSAMFITVNSQSTANLLPSKHHHKTKIIYPAVCINQKDNDSKVLEDNNLLTRKYFLCVGRLVKRKGQKQAILAWNKVIKTNPDYKLVIVGAGEMLKELQDLINDLKLNNNVIIISNATNEHVATLYQNAFSFLFPVQPLKDDNEGFGIVCLEAQYYGLPVITTATGGVVEAVNQSALLMNSGTIEEIATNVNEIISNPNLRSKLIEQSLTNVTQFSWLKSAQQLSDTIKQYEQR